MLPRRWISRNKDLCQSMDLKFAAEVILNINILHASRSQGRHYSAPTLAGGILE